MGKQFSAEYTDAEYSIDVAIPAERIAFEVDGPSHFARNTGTPLGATLLKRRHLAASGWTVLPINYNYVSDPDDFKLRVYSSVGCSKSAGVKVTEPE